MLDEALEQDARYISLEIRDRSFVRAVSATTLRRLGQIDDLIASVQSRPGKFPSKTVRDVLRLAVCELAFMNTPDHAALSAAHALLPAKEARLKGFVNGLLRALAAKLPEASTQQDAARLNTPEWLWHSWQQAHGCARAIAEAHLTPAPVDITVKTDPERWAEKLSAEKLPTGSLRLKETARNLTALPGYEEGAWWVQDAAAALAVTILADGMDLHGLNIADLCAAPGGKTLQLAALGATVEACDKSASRLERLRQNLRRTGLEANIHVADALEWQPQKPLDAVLLDAPCSATGTLRRHPELAHHRKPEDVTTLAELQRDLLKAACKLVKPGGRVVYATCSLQAEEGEKQIESLLESYGEAVHLDSVALPSLNAAERPQNWVRVLPHYGAGKGGIDGFFVARLVVNDPLMFHS